MNCPSMNQNMNSVPDASSHVTISNTWAVHVELSLKIYIFGRNNSWDEMRRLLAGEMSSQRPARYVVYIFGSYLGSVHLFIRPCYVPADAQLPLAAFIHFSYSVLLALLFLLSFFCVFWQICFSPSLYVSLFQAEPHASGCPAHTYRHFSRVCYQQRNKLL